MSDRRCPRADIQLGSKKGLLQWQCAPAEFHDRGSLTDLLDDLDYRITKGAATTEIR
jgi:hypothetical protein